MNDVVKEDDILLYQSLDKVTQNKFSNKDSE